MTDDVAKETMEPLVETGTTETPDEKETAETSTEKEKTGLSAEKETTTKPTPKENARAVQIVSIGTEENAYAFTFHEDKLVSVLSQIPPGWKVAVISVAGAFRTGKSFLLSWFLKYLDHQEKKNNGTVAPEDGEDGTKWYEQYNFLDAKDGFDWRGGAERNTTGIWIWSHPYFVAGNLGVILVDTQGMFDHETTMGLTASIFGLSTLLSSYQIYNVDKRIQEDNLQQLALFSEYARAALGTANEEHKKDLTPFQNMEFLVRDWQNFDEEEDLELMEKEMAEYLDSVIADRDAKDLKETREQINTCFHRLSCYLMSHPGFAVIRKTYNGDVSKMDPLFVKLLDNYCTRVFSRLEPKIIHGRELTAAELGAYIKAYANLFATGANFPEAATMLEATVSANNTNAVNLSSKAYTGEMDRVAGPHCSNYVAPQELLDLHKENMDASLTLFDTMANFGSPQAIESSRDKLLHQLRDKFEVYEKLNEGRNPLAGFETFLIPMAIALVAVSLRFVADNTCSSWSDTCRAGSNILSEIYTVVFFFLLIVATTKAKQISEMLRRVQAAFQALNNTANQQQAKAGPSKKEKAE